MRRKMAGIITVLVAAALGLFFWFFQPPKAKMITWGVVFSQMHAQKLGLDWKEAYLAMLDDLKVREIKIAVNWDMVEPGDGQYDFSDLDWQLDEAGKRDARVLLVIGMKTPRWPECHIPGWAKDIGKSNQQQEILDYLKEIVGRYRDRKEIAVWQVENEPLFPFGECPWTDFDFLKQEVALVKSLDPGRPVLISDSGEGSLWIRAAQVGDVVGTTMYRVAWFREAKMYLNYPIPESFYWLKSRAIKAFFNKKVVCVELQAEPWCPNSLYNDGVDEQKKTMDAARFVKTLDFAQKTGFDTFYLWGAEWWYWMKARQNDPAIWNEARNLWQAEQ